MKLPEADPRPNPNPSPILRVRVRVTSLKNEDRWETETRCKIWGIRKYFNGKILIKG